MPQLCFSYCYVAVMGRQEQHQPQAVPGHFFYGFEVGGAIQELTASNVRVRDCSLVPFPQLGVTVDR